MKAILRRDPRAGLYVRHWLQELWADTQNLLLPRRVQCPVCGWRGNTFHPYVSGRHITPRANCPRCESKPRHRVLYLYLQRELAGGGTRTLLDFAPVPSFSRALGRLPGVRYLSADLNSRRAMLHSDLRRLGIRSESVDLLVCYHVLEHIDEDRAAMRELLRILRPDGFGVIQVPIDPRLASTEEWGAPNPELHNHVRQYAPDFYDRLRESGFEVTVIDAPDVVGPADVPRYGLILESFCMVRTDRNASPTTS
jgi:SAM-dependent methyltransferase